MSDRTNAQANARASIHEDTEVKIEKILYLAKALAADSSPTLEVQSAARVVRNVFLAGPVAVTNETDPYGDLIVGYNNSFIPLIRWSRFEQRITELYDPHQVQFFDDVLMHLSRALPLHAMTDL